MSTSAPTIPACCDPVTLLEDAFRRAAALALGEEHAKVDPQVRPSQSPQFGDFQANLAMGLARQVGAKPRDVAARLAEAANPLLKDMALPLEVAGPGFINVRLKPEAMGDLLARMSTADLGIESVHDPHPIVVDLCGVNVAKQMHVGHLRSTIIGDALARVFERQRRRVIRQNHLGDWGLQIAMVLHRLRESAVDLESLDIAELERAYRAAQADCRDDEAGLAAARRGYAGPHRLFELEAQNDGAATVMAGVKRTLLRLQQGDAEVVADWQRLIRVTMRSVYDTVAMLGVELDESSERGESFYRDRLEGVVNAFERAGLARHDDGAVVVPFPDRERPLLIRKSDGGYLYATTDLAAIHHRVQELGAGRVIYVVDARQRDHFRDVFDAVRLIGWDITPDGARAELIHVPFGAVLGEDRRPLKTRSGENVTLKELLTEAIERGTREVTARAADPAAPTHGLPASELQSIGRAVGIGAVKYADLSGDLARDYVFNFDRMIAFEGDTGPYIQYAHARVCSIFSRAGVERSDLATAPLLIREPAERALALHLLRYGPVVRVVADSLEPHRLCTYLHDLAEAYSAFYQSCPVLRADDESIRRSRLRLCGLTRDVLRDGLNLLGIDAPERM